jgi:radical SAM protein with 4Fe4S-binding SPASM domain
MKEAGLSVIPKVILLRQNLRDWPRIKAEYGPWEGFKTGYRITPRLDGGQEPVACRASDEEAAALLCQMEVRRKRAPRKKPGDPVCGSAVTGCVVSAYGDIFPCALLPLSGGNVREKSFAEIWSGAGFDAVRRLRWRDMGECAGCDARAYCKPCPGRGWLEHGALTSPSPDDCRWARMQKAEAERSSPRGRLRRLWPF